MSRVFVSDFLFRPSTCLAALLAGSLAQPATAQQSSLWTLLSPDRIAARVLQMGIMALRSQAEVSYGTLSVSVAAGNATLTDLRIRPVLPGSDFADIGACLISFDRARLETVPIDDLDHARLQLQLSGGSLSDGCIPPEASAPAAMIAPDGVRLSRATLDLDYTLSTGAARAHAQITADGLASVGVTADFAYLWFLAPGGGRPIPDATLNGVQVAVENLGLWERVKPMLPPDATDPDRAAALIDEAMRQIDPVAGQSSPEAAALTSSAKAAWRSFLAEPKTLVLETGFSDGPRRLDLTSWKGLDGPKTMLSELKPQVSTIASRAAQALVPTDLLGRAYDANGQLSPDERLQVGIALATGVGAPRDLVTARTLLEAAVADGSTAAAAALASQLADTDPEAAYSMALLAAEAGEPGSAGQLDALEAALPLARVLALQHEKVVGINQPVEALQSLAAIRDEAGKRLSGKGRTRSYELAAMWAMLGKAAGDSESASMLAEIDAMVHAAGADAQAVWAGQERDSAETARNAWTGFNLPARFGAK